ncbi:SDR family NAD(P)-dependent oxidoreductase [Novosphingobium bradum]|uniref:SDR family NAD(P)-dependent oxidoreductase n=1 Tax=Novosphingobium bradum TaxID=1737444 RepID=A0ABV7IJ95_9SPHN
MEMHGASAVITGGAGGFGGATARRLARLGAKVVIADVMEERGRALVEELGNGSVFVRCDIFDEATIAEAVAAAQGLGPLRAAVVVHGSPPSPVPGGRLIGRDGRRLPVANFEHMIRAYLTGAFAVTSHAAEAMARTEPVKDGQRGVIINTASIAGFEGAPGLVPYSAAKGGVIAMTLTLARDLAPLGIRAMAIAPGTFLTHGYAHMTAEEAQAKYGPTIPNPQRMGDPEEYAMLAQQIVENDFLNGTVIRLDGAQRFGAKPF